MKYTDPSGHFIQLAVPLFVGGTMLAERYGPEVYVYLAENGPRIVDSLKGVVAFAQMVNDTQGSDGGGNTSGGTGAAPNPKKPKGTKNPETKKAQNMGNKVHYDKKNGGTGEGGPTQLQEQYPETEFSFTRRGEKGPDVEVTGGKHPSEYPGSNWIPENPYADFKPNTPSGVKTFERDISKGKLPENTQILPYDPVTGSLVH